jgi:L-ascorbate metabolism protein UlaG (beta-lactamase superfamily)
MKLKWLGHASFLITAEQGQLQGKRVLTDPYTPMPDALTYAPIDEEAEFVLVSHDHGDHSNVDAVKGNPTVVNGASLLGGNQTATSTVNGLLSAKAVASYHDDEQGGQRGNNAIFCVDVDDMQVCHLGDLGHPLSQDIVNAIGPVDVLLLPVGGAYTIDAAVATQAAEQLQAKVVVPMHYQNEKCHFPIAPVDAFLEGRQNVRQVSGSEVQLSASSLPQAGNAETIVLTPAN